MYICMYVCMYIIFNFSTENQSCEEVRGYGVTGITGKMGFSSLFLLCRTCAFFFQSPFVAVYCGEGNGNPLQYSCLENPMYEGAWWAAVHGVAKSPTRLSDFTFTFHFHALEKGMATHSSILAWRIPGTAESGRLPSMGSHRVGHD